ELHVIGLEGDRRIFLDVEEFFALDDGIEPGRIEGPDGGGIDRHIDAAFLRGTVDRDLGRRFDEASELIAETEMPDLERGLRMDGIEHIRFLREYRQSGERSESSYGEADFHGIAPYRVVSCLRHPARIRASKQAFSMRHSTGVMRRAPAPCGHARVCRCRPSPCRPIRLLRCGIRAA